MGKKQTVSLVLGSGGARGLAHIGVIEWLTENGFEIQAIAGSSIGALIGGFYAAGKLEAYTHWVTALERRDVVRLLDFSFGRSGLFRGERVITVLKELIGDCNIEDLPIHFTAIATDVNEEKEVWLNRGPLFDAIRASIAIPTILTPYTHDGKQLLDGGLINPIPIAPTLHERTELTIAVDLSAKAEAGFDPPRIPRQRDSDIVDYHRRIVQFVESMQWRQGPRPPTELGILDVITKSMDTMQNTIARCKLGAYSPDVTIEIPRNVCTFYEFHRARELIEIGRQRAEESLTRYANH